MKMLVIVTACLLLLAGAALSSTDPQPVLQTLSVESIQANKVEQPTDNAEKVAFTGDKEDEIIPWSVLDAGGLMGTNDIYIMYSSVGQTAIGKGSSVDNTLYHGFWHDVEVTPPDNCCMAWGTPGDANKDGSVNLTDILNAISYVYVVPLGEPQANDGCNALYDGNGDGLAVETPNVNLTDILNMISHVYVVPLGEPPLCCPPGCLYP